jgi:hypothetical protein
MPTYAPQILLGVALLIVLAIGLGRLAARLFMSATRGSEEGAGK